MHLFVVLSKIAFVETIFPYLKDKKEKKSYNQGTLINVQRAHILFKHLQTLKYKMFFTRGQEMRTLNSKLKLKKGMARPIGIFGL